MAGDIPHDEIRSSVDRGWTLRLLDALLADDLATEKLDEIVTTLKRLDDDRVIEPLRAVLFDRSYPWELRDGASSVLIASDDAVTDAELRAWWASEDDLVREHALYSMSRTQDDIVLAVADDDRHPLQKAALESMSVGFDDARSVAVAIRALTHADDEVRWAAARQLLWDEPVAAETALLRAAEDRDEDVAREALYALTHYHSQRVLLALDDLAGRTEGEFGKRVRGAVEDLAEAFEERLDLGDEIEILRLRTWAAPVAHLVSWPDVIEPRTFGSPRPPSPLLVRSEAEVLAILKDPDVPWPPNVVALRDTDWSAFTAEERARLRATFLQHPRRTVRYTAAFALAAWKDHEGLIGLATDPSLDVRRNAMVTISELPPEPAYAATAWTFANRASGMHLVYAISAYATHADPLDAVPRLLALANSDRSDEARLQAVRELTKLGAREALTELLPLLARPPITNWAVHTALLEAVASLELPVPNLGHLTRVDDLFVAEAVAKLTDLAPPPDPGLR